MGGGGTADARKLHLARVAGEVAARSDAGEGAGEGNCDLRGPHPALRADLSRFAGEVKPVR